VAGYIGVLRSVAGYIRVLRSVAGYIGVNKKRNADIRQELNIISLGENIKEYQLNCLEYI
jgi:hypothetical protein